MSEDTTNPAEIEGLPGDWRHEVPSLKEKVISAACWAGGIAWLLPVSSAMTIGQVTVGGTKIEWLNRLFSRGMVTAATWSKWTPHVHPDIRDDEPYIFAQNHINHLDFVAMYSATPHFKQGLESEAHFKYPVYGWLMKSRGTIPVPVDRDKRFQAVLDGIKKEVDQGHSILAFPEGTRTLNGRVGILRRGIFVAAQQLGIKVVPTAVTGMYDAMRKGSLLIRPRQQIDVWCEKPVDFAGVSDEDLPAKIEEVRSAIAARVDAHLDARAKERRGGTA